MSEEADRVWTTSVAVTIFSSISLFCTAFSFVLTLAFQNRASFLFSQPSFLLVMLFGMLLIQLSVYFLGRSMHNSLSDCTLFLWYFWVGSSLCLSAQCSRLYRALLVFRERSLRRPKQNTPKFFLSLLLLGLVPMALIITRMQIDTPTLHDCYISPSPLTAGFPFLALIVRLNSWGLLFVCIWFTSILEKLGATVDDAKFMAKFFFFIFFWDAILSLVQTVVSESNSDVSVVIFALSVSYSSCLLLYHIFALKIERLGLNGREMLVALRLEKETREINLFKRRRFFHQTLCCCRKNLKPRDPKSEAMSEGAGGNLGGGLSFDPNLIPPNQQYATYVPSQGDEVLYSDVILASMASRPVSLRVKSLQAVRSQGANSIDQSIPNPPPTSGPPLTTPRSHHSFQQRNHSQRSSALPPLILPPSPSHVLDPSNPGTTTNQSANDVILASLS